MKRTNIDTTRNVWKSLHRTYRVHGAAACQPIPPALYTALVTTRSTPGDITQRHIMSHLCAYDSMCAFLRRTPDEFTLVDWHVCRALEVRLVRDPEYAVSDAVYYRKAFRIATLGRTTERRRRMGVVVLP